MCDLVPCQETSGASALLRHLSVLSAALTHSRTYPQGLCEHCTALAFGVGGWGANAGNILQLFRLGREPSEWLPGSLEEFFA